MLSELGLIMKLKANKDNPDQLAKIYNENKEKMEELKNKFPNWQQYLQPHVLKELKDKGISF